MNDLVNFSWTVTRDGYVRETWPMLYKTISHYVLNSPAYRAHTVREANAIGSG